MGTEKWKRIIEMKREPIGDNGKRLTGCEEHIALSKQAAAEGIVLLKNDGGLLPFEHGTRLAVFGKAQIDYVKGGGGSGEVHSAYVRNIYESLIRTGRVWVFDKLSHFYEDYVSAEYSDNKTNGMFDEAKIPRELLREARTFTDTAVITINRFSGEGWDRKNDGKDTYFDLSKKEKKMIDAVTKTFEKVVVLINAGAMINTEWFAQNNRIQAALMIWQGGMEGAAAAADVLTGLITPSGKLVDTCAKSLADYPSSGGFHESEDYVKYTEDIFVGYRYFETIPGKKERVVYPFGYGLSYTSFELSQITAREIDGRIYVSVNVRNTGKYSGKEVVQLYYSAPQGRLTKAARELCAFRKTKLLAPGESETLTLDLTIDDMASYDDTGAIEKSAYIMEQGEYKLFLGNSVRDAKEIDYKHTEQEARIVKKLTGYCAPERLGKRLTASGEYAAVKDEEHSRQSFGHCYKCKENVSAKTDINKLKDVYNGSITLDEFIAQLTDDELISLLQAKGNKGVANTGGIGDIEKYGIPAPMTADGPAGVRIEPDTGIRTTAFPVATMLACTWNTELCEEIGRAGALEMKENDLSIWLTPALNIHRSPLCGRNFEYYSEDPYIAGKMAAAMVRGIQSQGIAATPKHFACNNKETNRFESDSVVSERALREIYLKGFEICIRESEPMAIMTSYNLINGVRASENAELITGILRGEWGYKGLVMTDWWNHASHYREALAGNDIRMPESAPSDLKEAFSKGLIDRDQVAACARNVLKLILDLE